MRELPPCYNKALDLLSRRSHFVQELRQKLLRRGYDDDEVTSVLERLQEKSFLDDRATALEFARQRAAREPLGRMRLVAELSRRGVDADLAREVAEEVGPEDDRGAAHEAAQRWRIKRPRGDAAALARYLARRGFQPSTIYEAVEDLKASQRSEQEEFFEEEFLDGGPR